LPARPPRSRPAWTGRTRGRGGRVERQPGRIARSGPDPPGAHLRAGAIGHRPCRARRRLQARGGHRGGPHARCFACRSIAISTSASGIYLDKLFARLAIDGALSAKIIRAEVTPVGELLPVAGIERCRAAAGPRAKDDLILRRRGGRLAGRGGRAGAYRLPRRAAAFASIERAGMVPAGKDPKG
jgi:hypothetical protein